jgi:hypothetical protein
MSNDNNYLLRMYTDGSYYLVLTITTDNKNFNWLMKKSLEKIGVNNKDKEKIHHYKKIFIDKEHYGIIDRSCNKFFREVNKTLKSKKRPLLLTRTITDCYIDKEENELEITIHFIGMWK